MRSDWASETTGGWGGMRGPLHRPAEVTGGRRAESAAGASGRGRRAARDAWSSGSLRRSGIRWGWVGVEAGGWRTRTAETSGEGGTGVAGWPRAGVCAGADGRGMLGVTAVCVDGCRVWLGSLVQGQAEEWCRRVRSTRADTGPSDEAPVRCSPGGMRSGGACSGGGGGRGGDGGCGVAGGGWIVRQA